MPMMLITYVDVYPKDSVDGNAYYSSKRTSDIHFDHYEKKVIIKDEFFDGETYEIPIRRILDIEIVEK